MPETQTPRQHWLAVLAKSSLAALEAAWQTLADKPDYQFLRPAETGLVMVRARAGGSGNRFNLGEISVTRCVVQLAAGGTGFGYVAGRSHRHAELAAVFDALLQQPDYCDHLSSTVIEPLDQVLLEQQQQRAAKAAATKVDFFTLVRGHT